MSHLQPDSMGFVKGRRSPYHYLVHRPRATTEVHVSPLRASAGRLLFVALWVGACNRPVGVAESTQGSGSSGSVDSTGATVDPASSGAATGSSTGSELPDGCGDGIVEPGQYCFVSVGLPASELTNGNIGSAAAIDIDDDGQDEFIVPYINSSLLVTFDGDAFVIHQVVESQSIAYTRAVRWDWDGDEREDLVVPLQYNQGDTMVLRNVGGSLAAGELHEVGLGYVTNGRPIPLDIDEDGELEFFVAVEAPSAERGGHIRKRVADEWVDVGPILPLPGCGATDNRLLSDFDGDGHLDLVVHDGVTACKPYPVDYDPTFHRVSVFLGNVRTGLLEPAGTFPTGGMGEAGMWADDFDRDGFQDLAIQLGDSFVVSLLTGNGDGTLDEPIRITTVPGAGEQWRLSPNGRADFDGDGDLEWFGRTIDGDRWILEDLLGSGAVVPLPPEIPSVLAVGDFNGDGAADFIDSSLAPLGDKQILLSNP